jgi:hypothetical protein
MLPEPCSKQNNQMFAGSLKQMDLSEVLKLLVASHQTGVLNLFDPERKAIVALIYLQVGQMVHAQAGAEFGLDAIRTSCKLAEDFFSFEENVVTPEQSLSCYPTVKLLEKMSDQIREFKALRLAMPLVDDIPVYLPGASLAGLEATADDLSLLIFCNGSRTVSALAHDCRRSLVETAQAIAKFRQAGIVNIKAQAAVPEPGAVPPSSVVVRPPDSVTEADQKPEVAATHAATVEKKIVRYWRGQPVYE